MAVIRWTACSVIGFLVELAVVCSPIPPSLDLPWELLRDQEIRLDDRGVALLPNRRFFFFFSYLTSAGFQK